MTDPSPTLTRHVEAVCQTYGVDRPGLLGPRKARKLVEARRELIYRLAVIEGWSTSVTGRMVGRRDHTTILYNVRSFAIALGWPPKTSIHALRAAEAMGRAA